MLLKRGSFGQILNQNGHKNYGQDIRVCFAKHTLSNTQFGSARPKAQTRPIFFFFWAGSSPAMRERFTHACNSNQLIILARNEGNLPRRAAAGGEVEGDWAKKKGLRYENNWSLGYENNGI